MEATHGGGWRTERAFTHHHDAAAAQSQQVRRHRRFAVTREVKRRASVEVGGAAEVAGGIKRSSCKQEAQPSGRQRQACVMPVGVPSCHAHTLPIGLTHR